MFNLMRTSGLSRPTTLVLSAVLGLGVSSASAQVVVITSPPPGSQFDLSSAAVSGLVIGTPGPAPVDEVYFRTLYPDLTRCPPLVSNGSYQDTSLGWDYDVEWNAASGIGTFEGRIKWMNPGQNQLEIYLPGGTLGTPAASQSFIFQNQSTTPNDIVALTHPAQRTIDVNDAMGNAGVLEFIMDLINTTAGQTFTVSLQATIELPDLTVIQLPMGGPGIPGVDYTIAPGDFSFTAPIDPDGMRFSFPLDQAPFPQPIQEGLYHMEVQVYDGPALVFEEEDIDFWVTDRSGKAFRDVTRYTDLKDVLYQGTGGAGCGLVAFDYNNDGLTDLFCPNPSGSTIQNQLLGFSLPYPGSRNFLMRNNGDGTFTDVAASAGVEGTPGKRSYGAAWGDLDDDGDNDLVVANRGVAMDIYRNNGDGTFTEAILPALAPMGWGQVVRLGDVDSDGDLDIYLGGYVDDFEFNWVSTGDENVLYKNMFVEGVFTALDPTFPEFTNISAGSGAELAGTTLSTFFWDYDRDGNLDISVHNDYGQFIESNRLLKGNGDGTFTDVTAASGYGTREFSMGAVAEDFNGDGLLDVYSTSIGLNSYLIGQPGGTFVQSIVGSGAEADFMVTGPQADGLNLDDNWSSIGFDYDRDMDVDLYVMGSDLFTTYQMPIAEVHPDDMFENDGNGQFTNRALDLGLGNGGRGRSAVLLDFDNDNDLDIVVANESEGLTLSRNDSVSSNHWIGVRPQTTRSAPGGFNTLFSVTAGGMTRIHEVGAESNHSGQLDNQWQIGLGNNTKAQVVAEWPRGGSTTVFSLNADELYNITETVIEVNGEIDGTAQVGTAPAVRMLGSAGELAIGVIGIGPGPFPLPSGGTIDVFPLLTAVKIAFINGDGEAAWPLGTMPANLVGASVDLQMVLLDFIKGKYHTKSGVSSLSITP